MNSLIGLGVLGTFGQPFGFQQTFYLGVDFNESLDLDENAIEVYPGNELFAVKREIVNGIASISFCIYSYVKELYSDRISTFIGTCIVLKDGYAEAEYIYKLLRELHNDTISNTQNIEDNTMKVQQAQNLVIREPDDFVAVKANVIPINKTPFYSTSVQTGKKFLVLPDDRDSATTVDQKIIAFFDESLKYYTDADTMYFTFDDDVAEFAGKKGFIKLIDWAEFLAYKDKSRPQSIVRTKKGIHKSQEAAEPHEQITPTPVSEVEHQVDARVISEFEPEVDRDLDNPNRPFDEWEEPEKLWSKNEITYRVTEYNRLFNYTNTLLAHIYTTGKGKNRSAKIEAAKLESPKKARKAGGRPLKKTLFGSKRRRGIFLLVTGGVFVLGGGVYNYFFSKSNRSIVSNNITPSPVNHEDTAAARHADSLKRNETKNDVAQKEALPAIEAPAANTDGVHKTAVRKAVVTPTVAVAAAPVKKVLPEEYVPDEEPKPATATVKTEPKKKHAAAVSQPAIAAAKPGAATVSPNIVPIKRVYSNPATQTTPTVAAAAKTSVAAKPAPAQPAAAKPVAAVVPKHATTNPVVKQIAPVETKQPVPAPSPVKKAVAALPPVKQEPVVQSKPKADYVNAKDLKPQPNFEMTQRDIVAFAKAGVKNRTVEDITRIIFENVPTNVGNVYRGQEAEYAALILSSNKHAFQKVNGDYICTSESVLLRVPAYKSPRLPVVFPK